MVRNTLILFVLLGSSAVAGPLCNAMRIGSIQKELGINREWEWFTIVDDYDQERQRNEPESRDYDRELKAKLPKAKYKRLQQLTFQQFLKQKTLGIAMGMTSFSDTEKSRIAELIKKSQKKLPRRQDEMVLQLQRERLGQIIGKDDADDLIGAKLFYPVAEVYGGNGQHLRPIGVDWLRCLNKSPLTKKLSVGQKRKVREFCEGDGAEMYKRGGKLMDQARKDAVADSTFGKFRTAQTAMRNSKEFKALPAEDQRKRLEAFRKTLRIDRIGHQAEIDALEKKHFAVLDERAKFVREFVEELIDEEQLEEVKQRVAQAGLIRFGSAVRPMLRQAGYTFSRADSERFIAIETDINLDAMREHVRLCMYYEAIEEVVGRHERLLLTGKRHFFPGPFGSIPNVDSELFEDGAGLIEDPANPRRR